MSVAVRRLRVYTAVGEASLQQFMAYRLWFWVTLLGQMLTVTLFVAFWEAVYASTSSLGGLHSSQTITYIILTQLLVPVTAWSVTNSIGYMIRDGSIATTLSRPFDLQARLYVEGLASVASIIMQQAIPIGIVAAL